MDGKLSNSLGWLTKNLHPFLQGIRSQLDFLLIYLSNFVERDFLQIAENTDRNIGRKLGKTQLLPQQNKLTKMLPE